MRTGGVFVGGALALVAVGAGIACRQLVGIGDDPPMDAPDASPAPVCGLAFDDAGACQACMESSCCTQASACADSGGCTTLEVCVGDCNGEPTCRSHCNLDHGILTDPAIAPLDACLAAQCSGACGAVCGGLAEFVPPTAAASCQECVRANACSKGTTCATELACQATLRCISAAPTLDVQEACDPDGGPADLGSAITAVTYSCSGQCAWGNNWTCVGHVLSPPALTPGIALTVNVTAFGNGTPVPDVTTTLCKDPCAAPFATGITDSDGGVTLQVDGSTGNWRNGYLSLSTPDASAGILPERAYWSFVLTQPQATLSVPTVTQFLAGMEALNLGVTWDQQLGLVLVQAYDCYGNPAPGVQFAITPAGQSQVFYFGTDSVNTMADSTNTNGQAVFINVPTQQIVLTATPEATGQVSSTVGFVAQAGGVTYVLAPPTP